MNSFFAKFRHFDIPLLIATALISVVGLALLYSTTVSTSAEGLFWRQVLFCGIGILGFFFFCNFDYHTLAKANRIIYLLILAVLIYLSIFGLAIRGGRRWIDLGFFAFQPAEFVKLVIILGLARLLYLRRGQINSWKNLAWSFLFAGLPASLILSEPDLGSALIIMGIWAGVVLLSPIKKKFVIILLLLFSLLAVGAWKFYLKDFQKDRILVFLNPALDPRGRGYNVKQATIAVGSGQWLGMGLGQGLQSAHKFLPEQQTDFIFAASAEEIGFLGITVLLALYFFIFYRLLHILKKARDDLGLYITGGVFFLLFWHVIINVSMNIGLLPVTGIPLPFLSAGGSSIIVTLMALGIVQNVAIQAKALRF